MIKRFFTTVILLTALTGAFAQVPGYMGKRFNMKLGMSFMPALFQPVYVSTPFSYGASSTFSFYGFFNRYNFNFDYTVGRRSTIGLAFHFTPAAFRSTVYDSLGASSYLGIMGANGYDIGIYYRAFFGKYLAPVGTYYKIELGGHIFHAYDRGDNYPAAYKYDHLGGTAYLINSFGRQHIFANTVSLDYGVDFMLIMPPWGGTIFSNSDEPVDVANRRLMTGSLFTMYVQLGVDFGKIKPKR